MSRIGTLPISYKGVKVEFKNSKLTFTGPLGVNFIQIPNNYLIDINEATEIITVKPVNNSVELRKFWGTLNRLMNNACNGVIKMFERHIKLVGLGYKVVKDVNILKFELSYSHPVIVKIPDGILITCTNATTIIVAGIDKQKVGEFAHHLTTLRKYNPYNKKGIILAGRFYKKKEMKK